eukprot:6977665-Prymnesium_polylepis.1
MAGKVSASLSFMHPTSTLCALSSTCVRARREDSHASVSVHRLHAERCARHVGRSQVSGIL